MTLKPSDILALIAVVGAIQGIGDWMENRAAQAARDAFTQAQEQRAVEFRAELEKNLDERDHRIRQQIVDDIAAVLAP